MNIRRTLLFFFLFMGLVPAAIIAASTFFQMREALKLEIRLKLNSEASALMEQVERMIFERVLQVHVWSHLELIQEKRVGGENRRLSSFLSDLSKHYKGIYSNILLSDDRGKIIAASDPSLIGRRSERHDVWLTAPLAYGETRLSPLMLEPATGRASRASMVMESAVKNSRGLQNAGKLQAVFDWNQIYRLLDQPGNGVNGLDPTPPLAALFDATGRVIAASAPLRERSLLMSNALDSWLIAGGDAVIDDVEGRLGFGPVLAGTATARGYQGFPGFRWAIQVYQPTAQAFAPIDRVATDFLLLFGMVGATAMALSLIMARRIAQPILQLAELTRNFRKKRELAEPIKIDKGELGELTQSFQQMIRDLNRSRAKLVRAAKLAVVGEMAATMAHEVRTPLGIMRSSVQILQREPSLSETGREMLDFILSENDRLNNLISSLLDCASPRQPVFKARHLHEIVQRVLNLLAVQANNKNIRLVGEFGATSDLLFCDEEQMLQLLLNLVVNAVQIVPPGGKVTVRTFSSKVGLVLNVDDNGPGIPENDRRKIFDPFYTQREGGIGLGLTVVQQIVRAHGGVITACSSPPGGARFHIFFSKERNTKIGR